MTPAARFAYGLAWMRYLAQRIGWPGVLGLALAVVAAGIDLLATGRLAEQNAKLVQGIARQRAQAARVAENNLPVHATLLAQLPGGSDLAPVVAAIHAGARQHQIALEQGEYVWQDGAANPSANSSANSAANSSANSVTKSAASYRMSFPASGTYPQLRAWANDILMHHPELVLEQFDFRRDSIASQTVEARVRFAVRVGQGT
jgi:hypothetical protein